MSASLLKNTEAVLEKRRPKTRHPGMIRFSDVAQVAKTAPILRAYLKEAMGYAEAGIKPSEAEHEIELPDELIEAMDPDPDLAEAFHKLTSDRQRSYVINLNSAKAAATRISRIIKFRGKILAGKWVMER